MGFLSGYWVGVWTSLAIQKYFLGFPDFQIVFVILESGLVLTSSSLILPKAAEEMQFVTE